jgi:nucleoside-diphosphate-sugar epimerase
MKILITGASGFIGSHITQYLLERKHQVAALIMPDDPMPRLQSLRHHIHLVQGTLEDTKLLEEAINHFRPETCIHLAWYAEPGKYLNDERNIQSLISSLSLFKMLIHSGCRHIATAGTCFEYDTSFGYLHEDTPTRPASLYAASKLSCLLMANELARQNNVAFSWGRIFYPYGPMEDERRLVPAAIKALARKTAFPASAGEQIRDYIHVADVASAFGTLVEKQADGIFNISTGVPVSVRQILETIEHLLNQPGLIQLGALPSRSWEPPFICGSNAKLKNLGWKPAFSLSEGLADTIRGIQQERESA